MKIVYIASLALLCVAMIWIWVVAKRRKDEIESQRGYYLKREKEYEKQIQDTKRELDNHKWNAKELESLRLFYESWRNAPAMEEEMEDLRSALRELASEQLPANIQAEINKIGWGIVNDSGVDYGAKRKEAVEKAQLLVKQGRAVRSTDGSDVRKDGAACLLDAFNGYVNFYVLKKGEVAKRMQMVKMAFYLVNLRAAESLHLRITEEYLNAQLAILRIQEEIAAYQSKKRVQDAEIKRLEDATQKREAEINKKLEALRAQLERAHAAEKARLEGQIAELEKHKRSISNAELTKKGTVYIISNVGSFGEDIYKIGMTRRTDPQERVDELGVASVPFPFDVHAFIPTNDAPKLEAELHRVFRQKKVNVEAVYGREFYRVKLDEIRQQARRLGYRCDDWVESPQKTLYKSSNLPTGVKSAPEPRMIDAGQCHDHLYLEQMESSKTEIQESKRKSVPDNCVQVAPQTQSELLDQLRRELNEKVKPESAKDDDSQEPLDQQDRENEASEFAGKLLAEIRQSGIEYDDSMMEKGGSLYLYDESLANRLKQQGYAVSYAAHGTKHNNHRPVWYIKVK